MHAPIPAVFSLLFLPLSFFLFVLSLLLVSYYSPAVGCSPFGLLGRPLGLAFHWTILRMGLWAWIQKMGINIQPPEHMDWSCDSYAKTYAIFFRGLFHNLHVNASFLFLRGPVVSIFTFLRQVVLFLSTNSWPFKGSQKVVHDGSGFIVVTPKRVCCKLCLFWACCMLSKFQ